MPLISRPNGPPVSTFRVVGRPSPDGSGGGDSTILAILNTHVRAAELGAQKSAGVPGSGFGGEGKQAATVHAVADARLQARHVQLPMVGHCVNDGRPVRVVALSDTHNLQKAVGGQPGVVVPDGDVLVHCGDFTNSGSRQEVQAFVDWFSSASEFLVVCAASVFGVYSTLAPAIALRFFQPHLWFYARFHFCGSFRTRSSWLLLATMKAGRL